MSEYLEDVVLADISMIINYLWSDEKKDWYESNKEDRKEHIFNCIKRVKKVLEIEIEYDDDGYDEDEE